MYSICNLHVGYIWPFLGPGEITYRLHLVFWRFLGLFVFSVFLEPNTLEITYRLYISFVGLVCFFFCFFGTKHVCEHRFDVHGIAFGTKLRCSIFTFRTTPENPFGHFCRSAILLGGLQPYGARLGTAGRCGNAPWTAPPGNDSRNDFLYSPIPLPPAPNKNKPNCRGGIWCCGGFRRVENISRIR